MGFYFRNSLVLQCLFFTLFFFLVITFNSGVWPMPNIHAQWMVSQNLTSVPFTDPNAHYLYSNYFMPALFGFLGGDSLVGYLIYSLATSFLFIFLIIYWFLTYHRKKVALTESKIFLLLSFPFTFIPFYWVGMDGMTLLLMAAVMISFKWTYWPLFFGYLLGLQHFEQGVLAFSLLGGSILLYFLVHKNKNIVGDIWRVLALGVTIALGKITLFIFFDVAGVELKGDRYSYLIDNIQLFYTMWENSWPYIIWSLLSCSWFIIFKRARAHWPLFVAITFAFLLLMLVGDQTRVGAIIIFPSIFYWILRDKKLWSSLRLRDVIFVSILSLTVPVVVVWGNVHGSVYQDSARVVKKIIYNNELSIGKVDLLSPFIEREATDNEIETGRLNEYAFALEAPFENLKIEQGERLSKNIQIRNVSDSTWPGGARYASPVNFSYRVVNLKGEVVVADGERTSLPHDIAPGVSLPLRVVFSSHGLAPGKYKIAPDLVHEGVTWFGGSFDQKEFSFIVKGNTPPKK